MSRRTRSSTLVVRGDQTPVDPTAGSLRAVSDTVKPVRPKPTPLVLPSIGSPTAPLLPTRSAPEETLFPLERASLTVFTYKPSATSTQPSPLPSTSAAQSTVLVNYTSLPWHVKPGDYFEIRSVRREKKETGGEALRGVKWSLGRAGFTFRVGNDATNVPVGQIQIPDAVASAFHFQHRADVEIVQLWDPATAQIDHIELRFSQYLGRADMWRLGMLLETQTVHVGERISLAGGAVRAEVHAIWRGGERFSSGIVTSKTKTIYRSKSAQVYLFIQLCAETWQFDEDGERYYEKIVHGFLPELFSRWDRKGASHVVTVITFARIHYDSIEVAYMEEHGITDGLTKDYAGRWCKDFFRVVCDGERRADWAQALPLIKQRIETSERELIRDFHLDLLTVQPDKEHVQRRLLGKWSFAYEGNVLETVNLALNPFDEHYIDRDLSRTGLTMAVITPGTGHFAVDKNLLRLTTERMVDHGFSLDMVCLTKMPLHSVPLFSYVTQKPKERAGTTPDLLYFDAHLSSATDVDLTDCYSIPKWVNASFFSRTADKRFRSDRFIARCKMYEIQMLGILDHIMTTVTVPLLETEDNTRLIRNASVEERKAVRDEFDTATFALTAQEPESLPNSRPASLGTSYQSARLLETMRKDETPPIPESPEQPSVSQPSVRSPSPLLIDVAKLEPLDLSKTQVRAASPAPSTLSLKRVEPASGNSTPQRLRHQPSKGSFAARFGPTWLFGAFSKPQPSQPTTAAETVGRKDVSKDTFSQPTSPVAYTTPIAVPGFIEHPPTPSPQTKPLAIARARPREPKEDIAKSLPRSVRSLRESHKLGRSPGESWGRSADFGKASRHISVNPCDPREMPDESILEGRRWQHVSPHGRVSGGAVPHALMKWPSLVTPACLPLTTDYLPTPREISDFYQVNSYEIVCFQDQVSFLIRPDAADSNLALAVMREMASQRLGQNFQYIVLPHDTLTTGDAKPHKKILGTGDIMSDDLRVGGASEALRDSEGIIYLLLSHHIHRLACDTAKQSVTVQRFVRRIKYETKKVEYKCLVWPDQMKAYQVASATFLYPDVESRLAFNYLDRLINGEEESFNDKVRYWRTRYLLIPSGRDPSSFANVMPKNDTFDRSEILMEGAERVLDVFNKLAVRRQTAYAPTHTGKDWRMLKLIPTSFDPSACVLDDGLMLERERLVRNEEVFEKGKKLEGTTLKEVGEMMCKEKNGLMIYDRWYHFRMHEDSFSGEQFCEWLLKTFEDVKTPDQAAEWARSLFDKGLIEHVTGAHHFHSTGHLFYRMRPAYDKNSRKRRIMPWFADANAKDPQDVIERHAKLSTSPYSVGSVPIASLPKYKRRQVRMSQSAVIDLDPMKRSDRAEVAVLHADIIHNARNALHFELNWLGVTAGLLEELRAKCAVQAEKFGLRFVEAPVEQIADISLKCAYRAPLPIALALPPPIIPDLHERLRRGRERATGNLTHWFEQRLLTDKFGFVLDVEAADRYPQMVDVQYTYRRKSHFDYSQYCHKSGLALVQCVGGEKGYLWADNRLFITAPVRGRRGESTDTYPNAPVPRLSKVDEARQLREELERFCSDKDALRQFWEEITPEPLESKGE